MDLVYWLLFGGLAAAAAGLELTKPADTTVVKNSEFKRFRNNYLLVYSLMMGGHMALHATQCVGKAPCMLAASVCSSH